MPETLPVGVRAHGDDGVTVTVHVVPNARQTSCVGHHGDALKIKLAAPPVDGRANDALQAWFASRLGLNRAQVELIQGASNRRKVLSIAMPAAVAGSLIRAIIDTP